MRVQAPLPRAALLNGGANAARYLDRGGAGGGLQAGQPSSAKRSADPLRSARLSMPDGPRSRMPCTPRHGNQHFVTSVATNSVAHAASRAQMAGAKVFDAALPRLLGGGSTTTGRRLTDRAMAPDRDGKRRRGRHRALALSAAKGRPCVYQPPSVKTWRSFIRPRRAVRTISPKRHSYDRRHPAVFRTRSARTCCWPRAMSRHIRHV